MVSLLVTALLRPSFSEAQQAVTVPRIGYVQTTSREAQLHLVRAFEAGLRERGYSVGSDIVIEYRFAEGRPERLVELVGELVRLKVDVIVTGVNPGTLAAKRVTTTIPIVMAASFNPVEEGLVASLARPGGNVTGLSLDAGPEILAKRLQLLREIVPTMSRVAALSGVGMTYNRVHVQLLADAGLSLGVTVAPLEISGADDLVSAFSEIARARATGLIVFAGPVLLPLRARIASMAVTKRLPTVCPAKLWVSDGCLVSYGADVEDSWRRAAGYVHRILKGARPADLPVEQPTKFELAINAATAKMLALTIPQSVLLQADHVVQ